MKITKTAIVGMGALGLMYGAHIVRALGKESVYFVMDSERYARHRHDRYTVNGVSQDFQLLDCKEAQPADLVIVAVKYNDLHSALDVMENLIDENTIIISVLNGIISEEIIAERYGSTNLLDCVAIGMDAMRDGSCLQYMNMGKLQIGITDEKQRPALDALDTFFTEIDMPHSVESHIRHAMWKKFMINVGINQTCMVYDTTYEHALYHPPYRKMLDNAMQEVIAISAKEGIHLTNADYESAIRILSGLNMDGYPSMRQDSLAHRKSEVELFAGTVIRIAAKHQIPVPANQFFYDRIQEIESEYEKV